MESKHPSLLREPSNLIGGTWSPVPGGAVRSVNPARPEEIVWSGSPSVSAVADAVQAARNAAAAWAATPVGERESVLRRFQVICTERQEAIRNLIRDETGKVSWDAAQEAALLASKVDITLDDSPTSPRRRVSPFSTTVTATREGKAWFRPHGVMAVIGPYNFPMHLPNGHIVPALLMGNTIVFKPSDKAPGCGQMLAELFHEALDQAGAPPGVFNLVQGGADVAAATASHPGLDGILFTGSWTVGRRILEANLDRPSRLLALEMGGNNPAVVMDDANVSMALAECVRSAFITTGQRCTCTRRIIVHEKIADSFLSAVVRAAGALVVGDPRAGEPVFMGPIISAEARRNVLEYQSALRRAGAEVLLEARETDLPGKGWYITPGVVRVTGFHNGMPVRGPGCPEFDAGCDMEVFGPIVRICVVRSLDEAIRQANATNFGLAASIFTGDPAAASRFTAECRAGCVNVNCGTAGASSRLPFGGVGLSGNHRPAGAFSLDYCAYPVAGLFETGDQAAATPGMTIDSAWLRS